MKLKIKPSLAPDREVDVTHSVIAAIAHELSKVQGGNDVLNWVEAEHFVLSSFAPSAQRPPRRPDPVPTRESPAPRPIPDRLIDAEYRDRRVTKPERNPARAW